MPSIAQHNYQQSGLILHTGARVRRRDPREDRYHARAQAADWKSIDLSHPHSLLRRGADGALWDPRPAVTDQGQKGACASFAVCEIAEMLSWQSGNGQPVLLSGSDLYERVRRAEEGASWREDTGSTLAGNLDLAMTGLYSEADAPESDDLARDYDVEVAGKTTYDYVLGHLPFYPNEDPDPDYALKLLCWCLDQGYPVDLGSYWPGAWFRPDADGILPLDGVSTAGASGHSYYAYEWRPARGGLVLCANHWTAGWNRQVLNLGGDARPGEFAIPAGAFRGADPLVFELRGVTWQPVTPQPTSCKDSALALAQPLVDSFKATCDRHPKNYYLKRQYEGAKAVVDALGGLD